ncbi:MAG: site-specific integrase [Candidatus Thiodiazotropha sp.]
MIAIRNGKWYSDFRLTSGKRVRKSLKAKTRDEALKAAVQLKDSLILEEQRLENKIPYPLREAFNRGFREHWNTAKSVQSLRSKADNICQYFGDDRQLASIAEEHIREWVADQRNEDLASATINRKLSLLSKLFKLAMHWGLDGKVVVDRVPYMPRQKEERNRRHRIITDEELSQMLQALRDAPQPSIRETVSLFPVLLDLGCRLSEALNLVSEDIDWVSGTVIFWETKNGKPRRVPMTSRVRETFKGIDGPLFNYDKHRAETAWTYAREAIGLKQDKRFVIHALRHTCATRLLNKGARLEQVQAWLGHADITTTQIYAHYDTRRLVGLQNLLESSEIVTDCAQKDKLVTVKADTTNCFSLEKIVGSPLPSTHNPLVLGSSPSGPTNNFRVLTGHVGNTVIRLFHTLFR